MLLSVPWTAKGVRQAMTARKMQQDLLQPMHEELQALQAQECKPAPVAV